jgi:hypothetical protein
MAGRKTKRKKIGSSELGVIEFPTRSIYLEAVLRFPFESIEEFNQKKEDLKLAVNEFYLDLPSASLYSPPIIHFSTLSPQAIKTTKVNTVIMNTMFFLRKPIFDFNEIRVDLFEKFLEEIQI